MERLFVELRLAGRALWRRKSFSLLVMMTLAASLGCVAAVLTLTEGVLLRPLPYPRADELALLFRGVTTQAGQGNDISPGNCVAMREARVFRSIACWMRTMTTVRQRGEATSVSGMRTDASLLEVLEGGMAQGRMFDAGETSVVVLTHEFWQRQLGGRAVLGTSLEVDGAGHTVVGVLRPGFRVYQQEAMLLLPLTLDVASWASQDKQYLQGVARIDPRVGWKPTLDRVAALARSLESRYPVENRAIRLDVTPMQEAVTGQVRGPILMLLATTALLLGLGLMNLANLFVTRMRQREKELSIRRSLGANAWQMARQIAFEPLLLAVAGGALGLVLAQWSFALLRVLVPPVMEGQVRLGPSWDLVAWMALLVVVSTVVLAAPLFSRKLTQADGFQSVLLSLEVACALMLVVAAHLLGQSWKSVLDAPLGMNAQGLLIARVEPPDTNRLAFYNQLEADLRAKPGVTGVTFASSMPLTWRGGNLRFQMPGEVCEPGACIALYREVTSDYFRTLEVPLKKGRYLGAEDRVGSEPVAVVNETWVRRFAGARDPIGMRVTFEAVPGQVLRVVGVVADTREMGLATPPRQTIYIPYAQTKQTFAVPTMVAVRAARPNAEMLRGITTQPVSQVMTMQALIDEWNAPRRNQSLVSGGIALAALLMAGVGLYGMLSYALELRRREMGIRIALGADGPTVLRTLAARPMVAIAAGVGAGLIGAVWFVRWIEPLLTGVRATSPEPYLVSCVVLVVWSVIACAQPVRQALRIPPAEALRQG